MSSMLLLSFLGVSLKDLSFPRCMMARGSSAEFASRGNLIWLLAVSHLIIISSALKHIGLPRELYLWRSSLKYLRTCSNWAFWTSFCNSELIDKSVDLGKILLHRPRIFLPYGSSDYVPQAFLWQRILFCRYCISLLSPSLRTRFPVLLT